MYLFHRYAPRANPDEIWRYELEHWFTERVKSMPLYIHIIIIPCDFEDLLWLIYNNTWYIIGSKFSVWTGGLAYPGCSVALLAVVVTGYHTHSTYSWNYSIKPRLLADLNYRPSAHQLSTTILWTSTCLYGIIYKDDVELRLCSKAGSGF